MQVKKQQLELDMGQLTGSKFGKEYDKAMLSSCLFNFYAEYTMWNAELDKPQAGVKTAGTEISTTSVMQMIPLYGRNQNGTKEPLDKSERGEGKS